MKEIRDLSGWLKKQTFGFLEKMVSLFFPESLLFHLSYNPFRVDEGTGHSTVINSLLNLTSKNCWASKSILIMKQIGVRVKSVSFTY